MFYVISGGVAIICASFIQSYGGLVVFITVYGFFVGGIVSFYVVVVGSIVRRDQLPQALGWALFTEGPSSIIAAPIAGWIHDATCSYSKSFYFSGSSFILAFGIMCLVLTIRKRARSEEERKHSSGLEDNEINKPVVFQSIWKENRLFDCVVFFHSMFIPYELFAHNLSR
eukprot:m.137199 g.137199  ORF g.137199 m.137199 type:complete len:170 (+) comp38211_c0_seq2:677-1186(+)